MTADITKSLIHLLNKEQKRIRFNVSAYPDKVFYSSQYILFPQGSSNTRTVLLHLSLPNTEGILCHGAANIRLRGTSGQTVIVQQDLLLRIRTMCYCSNSKRIVRTKKH